MWMYCAAARITMRSPSFTSVTFVSTSVPSTCCQTFSTRRLMAEARSATDFLWVHSSRISPSRSMSMTEPAVAKSPRTIDTVTAVASSTATDSFQCHRARSPSLMYFAERITASADVTGAGRNRLEAPRRITVRVSLSSNSRFKAREVCSGAKSSFSAFSQQRKQRPYAPRHPGVFLYLPPNLILTICIFIMPSPTLARKRKKPLTDGSFKSL